VTVDDGPHATPAAPPIEVAPGTYGPLTAVVGDVPRSLFGDLAGALDARGLEHEVVVVSDLLQAERSASDALDSGRRFVVAVGGDAMVQAVLNGMFRGGETIVPDPVLGIVGAGSGNDLLRCFGLPDEVEGGVRRLEGAEVYPLDVVRVIATDGSGASRARYAANIAEVGLGAAAVRAGARLPARLGPNVRRFAGFWLGYAASRRPNVTVEADRGRFAGRAWNVVVGNGQFTDGLRLSPRSFPGDGVVEALVFSGPKSQSYRQLPDLFRHGDHVPHEDIRELRATTRISVDADRPMPVVADGQILGRTPAVFEILAHRVLLKL
jgi:diacylglycerol kinase family enzyme